MTAPPDLNPDHFSRDGLHFQRLHSADIDAPEGGFHAEVWAVNDDGDTARTLQITAGGHVDIDGQDWSWYRGQLIGQLDDAARIAGWDGTEDAPSAAGHPAAWSRAGVR